MLNRVDLPDEGNSHLTSSGYKFDIMVTTCTIVAKDGSYLPWVYVQVHPLHSLHLLLLPDSPESFPQVSDHDGLCASHGVGHSLGVLVLGEGGTVLPVKDQL